MSDIHEEKILILDFGSQYTMLIARRVRELKVYCEIHPCHMPIDKIREFAPKGIILSGGPDSVTNADSPRCDLEVFKLGVPVLGICYGFQLMSLDLGGEVEGSDHREYGPADLVIDKPAGLFKDVSQTTRVWMSHGDRVAKPAPGFEALAHSDNSPMAAAADLEKNIYGVQFHPEVHHTPEGKKILGNFVFDICGCKGLWTVESFIDSTIASIRAQVGDERVIMALSGGVDSSVAATLIHRAIGDQLTCIFVNNGLLRHGEPELVQEIFNKHFHMDLRAVDASERFLTKLAGVTDPEKKRKIIGKEFIRVFEEQAKSINRAKFLGQGTLYPDVIESVSVRGPSATIKSHHNVGGLPEIMKMELIEPLRELFKDEVREVGLGLGLKDSIVFRQPFPGPGLAVRIMGEITEKRLKVLRAADHIATGEIEAADLNRVIWQYFAVLLPVKSVGVMGDDRTYDNAVALRAVTSVDGMTADFADIPHAVLSRISSRIINEVKGVNRVVYDISSKPPSTIEWE